MVGLLCMAGSANASTLLSITGTCVSVAGPGCLFTGKINDQSFAVQLLTDHPDSYLNAENAYNTYVTSSAYVAQYGAAGQTIELAAIGESEGDPAAWAGPPFPASDPIVNANCADPLNQYAVCGGDIIGQVNFCTSTTSPNPADCALYNPNKQLMSGDWQLTVSEKVSFVSIDGGGESDLYELATPATSGGWNTYNNPTGNKGLTNPQLYSIVLFAAVPEPATWAMFLLGFGVTGASLRVLRRKGAAATA
jgi:hypothetical protein